MALRVGVVIAYDLWPALPARGAVRVDQSLRVDLEMGGRRSVDIGGGPSVGDPPALAQQNAASLVRVRVGGMGAHGGKGPACHFDPHRAWP